MASSFFFFFNSVLLAFFSFPWGPCGYVSPGGRRLQKKAQPGLCQTLGPGRTAVPGQRAGGFALAVPQWPLH